MQNNIWIRSLKWDSIFILSPLALGIIGSICLNFTERWAGIIFFIFLWGPHLGSSMWVPFINKEVRNVFTKNPFKNIFIPLIFLMAAICFAIFGIFKFTQFTVLSLKGSSEVVNPLVILACAYTLWATYHTAAQNFGILSIYRAKGGLSNPLHRSFDRFFCIVVLWVLLPFAAILLFDDTIMGTPHFNRLGPFLDDDVRDKLGSAVQLLSGLFGLVALLIEVRSSSSAKIPRSILFISFSLAPIGVFYAPMLFFSSIYLHHWVAAIALALHGQKNYLARSAQTQTGFKSMYWRLFFFSLPLSLSAVAAIEINLDTEYFTNLQSLSLLAVVIFGFRIGASFVHYFCDRLLYSFSSPQIRATFGKDIFTPHS